VGSTREDDLHLFRAFVDASRWRFAKTVTEPFLNTNRKYLHLDERKYWHMGNPSSDKAEEQPTLINRAWLDPANYREEAKALGYDDENLEKMVTRWRFLLERAQGLT